MTREWTAELRHARKRLITKSAIELEIVSDPDTLELTRHELAAYTADHCHEDTENRYLNCSGCFLEILDGHFEDELAPYLSRGKIEATIRYFESQLKMVKESDISNDQFWATLETEAKFPSSFDSYRRIPRPTNRRKSDDDPSREFPTGRNVEQFQFSTTNLEAEENKRLQLIKRIETGPALSEEPISVGGEIVNEPGLPLPFVLYPQFGGSIPAFSDRADGPWYLCSCHKPGIQGIVSLIEKVPGFSRSLEPSDVVRREIALLSLHSNTEVPQIQIEYRDEICHHCNQQLPKLETFRSRTALFISHPELTLSLWSMYFRIECLKNGLQPTLFEGQDNCWELASPDILHFYEDIKAAGRAYYLFHESITFPVPPEYHDEWMTVNYEIANSWTRLFHFIENQVRARFDVRPIGSTGQQEDLLHRYVLQLLPSSVTVIRSFRPGWLERLELDIWIPELKVGIEYQGEQHYRPIEAWGGIEGLRKQQLRDARKKVLCEEQKISLIEFRYDEKLTRALVAERLSPWISVRP